MSSETLLNNSDVEQGKSLFETQKIDPQVKANTPRRPKRKFSKADKVKILAALDACEDASARGALIRREGLYYSGVAKWRREQASQSKSHQQHKTQKNQTRVENLARENEQLKKKLAQAEAIIDLQKKVSELFGNHILPQMNSEMN